MVAVYRTTASAPDTFSYYTSNPRLTTNSGRSVGAGAGYVGTVRIAAPYNGSVTVLSRGGTTYIVVVLKVSRASPSP